jgi:colanic acid/amylovoran biosynthesis glycosyltransferase
MGFRLALVTGTFPQLSETFIYRKAVSLAQRGHDVTMFSRARGDWRPFPGRLPGNLQVEVLPPDGGWKDPTRALRTLVGTVRAGARSTPRAAELWRLCQIHPLTRHAPRRAFVRHAPFLDCRADVVHFEFLGTGSMYPLARFAAGCPVVVSCRGSDIHMLEFQQTEARESMTAFLRTADAVHCVSDEIRRTVQRTIGERDHLCVNRGAVMVDQIRARPFSRRTPVRILATGRLTWKKGFDYLLASLAAVKRSGLDFKASILGDGELLAPLRFSVRDLGLAGNVTFEGAVAPAEVLARLQDSDIFVLPSLDEGISNAVLEAMASGVPIITTDVGGMTEAVRNEIDGIVVPPRDVLAMTRAISRLIENPSDRSSFGLNARQRAEADFSIERQARTFEQLYSELVA